MEPQNFLQIYSGKANSSPRRRRMRTEDRLFCLPFTLVTTLIQLADKDEGAFKLSHHTYLLGKQNPLDFPTSHT